MGRVRCLWNHVSNLNPLGRPSVAAQLSVQTSQQQSLYNEMLLKVLSTLRYWVRQGLAIRGHHHDNDNFNSAAELSCTSCC